MSLKFQEVFQSVDNSDTRKFLSFLSEDAVFRFANLPEVKGKKDIGAFLDNFFSSIDHTTHSNLSEWQIGDTWFITGTVTYTRKDGTELSVPFANQFNLTKDDKIKDYLIFVDNSELYQ
jgi:ketosteroid isomerase-like protein